MAEVFYENRGKKYNYRSKNGTPYFRKSVTINGKVHTFYGDGEKDCLIKIEEAKALTEKGIDITLKNAKVCDVMEDWLMNIKRVDKDLKASSFARYEASFRVHIKDTELYSYPLRALTTTVMQGYVNDLYEKQELSGPTIKNVIRVWRMFFGWAIEEGYLSKDPTKNISLPGKREKAKRKFETFDADERLFILSEMNRSDYWYKMLMLLAFDTGMRQGELLGLRWEDIRDGGIYVTRSTAIVTHVDGEGSRSRSREIWDPKTANSVRFIPLRKEMLAALTEFKERRELFFGELPEYVFTTQAGKLVDSSSFAKSYRRLLTRAGVDYRKFHAIRHTFATEAIRQGVNIKDLQMLMGHSDVQTTLMYIQSDEKSKRAAIDNMVSLVGI